MSVLRAALALALAAIAACSKGPTCGDMVDHVASVRKQPLAADVRAHQIKQCFDDGDPLVTRQCVMAAADESALQKCILEEPGLVKQRSAARVPSLEGRSHVVQLADGAVSYYASHHAFPAASAGPTPPLGDCCKQGGTCPADPSMWAGTWRDLAFTADDPIRYSLWYEVKDPAREIIVHAIGDLDCNGVTSDFAIHVAVGAVGAAHAAEMIATRPEE